MKTDFMKRLTSFLTALALVLSIMVPSTIMAEGEGQDETTTTGETYDITLHKIVMDSLEGWPKDKNPDGTYTGNGTTKYDGSAIDNITEYFGSTAKKLKGVHFELYKANDENTIIKEGKTGTEGSIDFTGLEAGDYVIKENREKTKLEGDEAGKTISDQVAVPVKVTLPVYKADGSKFTTIADGANQLHVYPKNTVTDKPDVDKKINDENKPGTPENPADYTVGDKVPYKITTTIKPGAKYKTAYWNDKMTEGLTFTQSDLDNMVIKIDGSVADGTEYEKILDGNGFIVKLTEAGLSKINDKAGNVEVELEYEATLNSAAVVQIPESNDVTFIYGNNPGKGNTPIPTKPSDGKITVNKTWADGIELPAEGIEVTFTLYNAKTGEKVEFGEGGQSNPIKIKATSVEQITHTWTGLDDNIEYKVVETYNGYEAEYGVGDAAKPGTITVKNHKTDNPEPIVPDAPKVITYGKKFVKTDSEETPNKLGGAQFIIKDPSTGKYLKMKSAAQTAEEEAKLAQAKAALDNAVKAYNERSSEDDEAALLAAVESAQTAYDEAVVNAKTGYEWIEAADDNTAIANGAYVLISNANGEFEIRGLETGDYQLVETKAPEGYAKLNDPIDFKVDKDSYEGPAAGITHPHISGAQQVKNKKVDIPQTGGMGTVLFTIAGLGLMTLAFVMLKKKNNEA
ncbi:MAG: isopeptide-forming domain-containing fimbrial protein [Andreesenia angusta]|nr:isopeptide-forming domain-containing fimbrial protein [Andreesenia angusta]